MTLDREAFLEGYLAEVEEHIGAATRQLLVVSGATDAQPRAVREIFRSLHTVKGLSAMVGVESIVELAHAMEIVVRAADATGGRLPPAAVDLLVEGVRAIEQRLRLVEQRKPVPAAPAALIEALRGTEASPAGAAATAPLQLGDLPLTASEREEIVQGVAHGRTCSRIEILPSPARAAAGLTITTVRERIAAIAELVRVVPLPVPRGEHAPGGLSFALVVLHDGDVAALAAAAGVDAGAITEIAGPEVARAPPAALERIDDDPGDDVSGGRGDRVVRVEVSRLDDALERLSALIVTRFRMGRAIGDLAGRGVDVRRLVEIMNESARQLRDLRSAIMRARMVSVAELLERVPLMVRGLSRATGKAVSLELDAGRAELDKAVGERIFPAIVHLVRNAIDHAIETREERSAAGKPPEGQIRLTCHERSNNQLELTISDDGRGVDREAVARRAGRPVPASDDALLDLLATPGLTTLDHATTTSGRGLGVDIVRRIVRDLGGGLRLETRAGQGTTFTMRVPLSITIMDAFSFVSAGHVFVAPVASIDEIVEIDAARTTRTPQRAGLVAEVRLLERRGVAVPLVQLDEVFALRALGGDAAIAAITAIRPKALIVRRAGAPYAFAVDRMLGQQEVVVRPIVDDLVRVPGVTGSTDLGDGHPVLVLDLVALTEHLGARGAA